VGKPRVASGEYITELIREVKDGEKTEKFSLRFLLGEWEDVIDAWQLQAWEEYRDVNRLGRKTRLSGQQRAALWEIFEKVKIRLAEEGLVTRAALFSQLAQEISNRKQPPFDFAVVDEAQDISVGQLRFLSALGGGRPNALFFAGDLGQRIFQMPFSWKSLGIDVRGRSRTLRLNYRTSHQIRMQADQLLGAQVSDVDGNIEDRRGTVSVFNGPPPVIEGFERFDEEIKSVSAWINKRIEEGVAPHEIGVFVRSQTQIDRGIKSAEASGIAFQVLDDGLSSSSGALSVSTMHLAKGLEFRAVVVMACDDEVIPLQERMESVSDEADLQEVYDTERHLLYVACTRARDYLLITGVEPVSEFLDDLQS
jgi:superfamily I DNA/RNA helicase